MNDLPEQLPRAKPTDEGPFLIEVHPKWRPTAARWWRPNHNGFTNILAEAGRYGHEVVDLLGFDHPDTYPVLVPSLPDFDLTTRLGRVQAAWWLRDLGAPQDVMSVDERRAYNDALLGHDDCNIDALRSLFERYKEDK